MKYCLGLLLLLVACRSPGVVDLAERFEVLSGKLVAEPALEAGGTRLFLYIQLESEVEKKKSVRVCLAGNIGNKDILSNTRTLLLSAPNEPVFIYASRIENNHEEIISGVDYYIHAIGVYVPAAQKYRVIQTDYSPVFDTKNWKRFLYQIIEKGADKAL